jgi:Ring finger domain
LDFDDQDEHACVICLDCFQEGDIVSWSRFSDDCHHVFHSDCIGPWLEDKRQEDCPSCRNRIILLEPRTGKAEKGADDGEQVDTVPAPELMVVDSDEADPSEKEEDSIFMIVHGLISRAAKKASYYTFVGATGSKISLDQDEMIALTNTLPLASPFRRVASHEPRPSPRSSPQHQTMMLGRKGAFLVPSTTNTAKASSPTAASALDELSIHRFLPSSSSLNQEPSVLLQRPRQGRSSHYDRIKTNSSCESNDDESNQHQNGIGDIEMLDWANADDTSFRRVKSDVGVSSPYAVTDNSNTSQYPMIGARTRAPHIWGVGGDDDDSLADEDDLELLQPCRTNDIFRRPMSSAAASTPTISIPSTPSINGSANANGRQVESSSTSIQHGGEDADDLV